MSSSCYSGVFYGDYISGQVKDDLNDELNEALVNSKEFQTYKHFKNIYIDESRVDSPEPLKNYDLLSIVNGSEYLGVLYYIGYAMKSKTIEDEKKLCGEDIFLRVDSQLNELFEKLKPFTPNSKYKIQTVNFVV